MKRYSLPFLALALCAALSLSARPAEAGFFDWAKKQADKLQQGVKKVAAKVDNAVKNVAAKLEDFAKKIERGLGQLEKVGEKIVRFISTGVKTAEEVWEQLKTVKLTMQERWSTTQKLVDLRPQFNAFGLSVEDQGATTTCMAQATTTAFEYMTVAHLMRDPTTSLRVLGRKDPRGLQLSRRHVYWLSRHGLLVCNDKMRMWGSWGAQAASWLKRTGTFEEKLWPFAVWNPFEKGKYGSCLEAATNGNPPPAALAQARFFVRDWRYLPGVAINDAASSRRVADLRGILARGYPIVISVFTFGGHVWSVPKTNPTVKMPPKVTSLPDNAHYVTLLGYDDARQAFLFVNSWGKNWGVGGFGYLPYDYVRRYIIEGLVIREVAFK